MYILTDGTRRPAVARDGNLGLTKSPDEAGRIGWVLSAIYLVILLPSFHRTSTKKCYLES
jgi:hypothetical protein